MRGLFGCCSQYPLIRNLNSTKQDTFTAWVPVALKNFANDLDCECRGHFTRVMPTHPIRDDQKAEVEVDEPGIFVCRAAALMGHARGRQRHWTPDYSLPFVCILCILLPWQLDSYPPTLARVAAALERGRGADVPPLLQGILKSGSLSRDDELGVRAALAEAWLLQDDLTQASSVLGRPPDTFKEQIRTPGFPTRWRLHGRIAFARGEQSRAIALHTRALKHAELAHDSRAIGLAHYELALCYKQVGDSGIVREHLTEAASALHAVGDHRHLALVHSLSAVLLAQSGRTDEAINGLRLGERLAMAIPADDVLAGIVHNQANVALMQHRHEQALVLAERSVALHQSLGSGHGLAVALATLGQIFVQLGDLERAEQVLTRTLEVRSSRSVS